MCLVTHTHTHTRIMAHCPGLPRWAGTGKVKTNLNFTEARGSEWQWHQLGHMQAGTSLQTDDHASTPPLSFLQARCPSCRPTNSVKALNGYPERSKINKHSMSCRSSFMSFGVCMCVCLSVTRWCDEAGQNLHAQKCKFLFRNLFECECKCKCMQLRQKECIQK